MKRALTMLIAICILLCSASCSGAKKDGQSESVRVDLTLEHPECIYSEDFCDEISTSITNIIADIIFNQKELVLTNDNRAKLKQSITDELLPLAKTVPIYPEELRELCEIADELILSSNINLELFGDFYTHIYEIIGGTRAATLCYDSLKFYIEYSLERAEYYYSQTQYSWYAEDIKKSNRQFSLLCNDIGKESFSIMLAPFILTANALFGSYDMNVNGKNPLSKKDTSLLIDEYLYELDEHKINSDKWQKAWMLFELFEIEKLSNSDAFIKFGIEAVRKDMIVSYLGSFTYDILHFVTSICKAPNITEQTRSDALTLDAKIRASFPECVNMRAAIERANKLEDFNSFVQTHIPHDTLSLLDILNANTPESIRELCISYLLSISPELAYFASYALQSEVNK